MNAKLLAFAIGSAFNMTALLRYAALLLLALTITLFPAKDARAESAIDVLFKVCDQVKNLCGPDYPAVAKSCFLKSGNELDCALAILNVASGGQSKDGIKQVNAIIACIKTAPDLGNKAKFDATCRPLLQAAGVDVGKIDEVYNIAGKCANADDVDDFIYCADALIDSSIADEADIGIPTWVNSLFDIYIDIDQKDYWGLVYDVGATVACAVANYFTGLDVCAFFEDIAEFAGDVADGVKAVGGALNNAGEKVFTNQTKHVPVVQFFNDYWLPEVDNYAKAIVAQQNSGYWSANVGEKFKHCRNYFDSHTMSENKASRACADMRDGTAASDDSFIDKGFSQLASRRGAIMLLSELTKSAAVTRIAQLRGQGAFKATSLPGPQVQYDPWKSAPEVPGVEAAVFRAYGLSANGGVDEPPLKRDAKTVNEAWRTKTVGYGAYMLAQAAKVAPATLNFPTSEAIAKKAITNSEGGIDIAGELKAFIASAQADRMKGVDAFVNINKGFKEGLEKPLKEMLVLCIPKATAICEAEVRERFKVCDAKAKAFYDANAGVIGDFDNKRGKDAMNKWGEIRATCEAEVKAYVVALPNVQVDTSGTQSCKLFLGRPTELLCPDAASFVACQKQVDIGDMKSCRQMSSTELPAYTKDTAAAFATGTQSCKLFLGRADELLCADAGGFLACRKQVDMGKMKTCRQTGSQQLYTKSSGVPATGSGTIQPNPVGASITTATLANGPLTGNLGSNGVASGTASDTSATKACKQFLGRADELLCPDVVGFNACKVQVDIGKMKTCRQTGSQQVYSRAVTTGMVGGSTSLSGNGLKPGSLGLSPPAVATPKVDEAALRLCKSFLGRKDEMLCSEAQSFAACKTAVDAGQMKTCRLTNTQEIYPKR